MTRGVVILGFHVVALRISSEEDVLVAAVRTASIPPQARSSAPPQLLPVRRPSHSKCERLCGIFFRPVSPSASIVSACQRSDDSLPHRESIGCATLYLLIAFKTTGLGV